MTVEDKIRSLCVYPSQLSLQSIVQVENLVPHFASTDCEWNAYIIAGLTCKIRLIEIEILVVVQSGFKRRQKRTSS